jgi:hypothetical protein
MREVFKSCGVNIGFELVSFTKLYPAGVRKTVSSGDVRLTLHSSKFKNCRRKRR